MFLIASVVLFPYSANYASAASDAPTVSLDRSVYPVPFGHIGDFEKSMGFTPDGRSLFPVHRTAITSENLESAETWITGDLTIHIRITDANFDLYRQDGLALFNEISQDVPDTTVGPLKISVSRDSQTVVLAYAGGSTPNENGVIDVGDNNQDNTRQLGSLSELASDSGIFELDFVVRYTDGPSDSRCPATAVFTSLDDDVVSSNEESRFDELLNTNENYCILTGDVLIVEYTYLDELGNIHTITDSATFELQDGTLESDKQIYSTGHHVILTLTEPDFDLDNNKVETYDLDLIEWDSYAATVTLGPLGGEMDVFDPKPPTFRETGDSTGIFQAVIEIPQALQDNKLERGEEIVLEYTDWGSSAADYVGREDHDVDLTIYTYDSPLKQIKLGIALSNIQCSDEKHVIYKHDRMRAACVTSSTYGDLTERGWAALRLESSATSDVGQNLCKWYGGNWDKSYRHCSGLESTLLCTMAGGNVLDDNCFIPKTELENEN